MIYNLEQFLIDNFGVSTSVNGWRQDSDDSCLRINDNGGETPNLNIRRDHNIQLVMRAIDSVEAKQKLDEIHEGINNHYDFSFPEVTVNSKVYPEVRIWRVNSTQDPYYMGTDDNGRNEYVVNYIMTTQ